MKSQHGGSPHMVSHHLYQWDLQNVTIKQRGSYLLIGIQYLLAF